MSCFLHLFNLFSRHQVETSTDQLKESLFVNELSVWWVLALRRWHSGTAKGPHKISAWKYDEENLQMVDWALKHWLLLNPVKCSWSRCSGLSLMAEMEFSALPFSDFSSVHIKLIISTDGKTYPCLTSNFNAQPFLFTRMMWFSAWPDSDWGIPAPVCVVYYSIEGLVDPLPEKHCWCRSWKEKQL